MDFDEIHDNYIEPFIRLWRGEGDMKENLQDISPILEETGRIIYQNSNITVNTLPAILAALLLGALVLKLFFGLTVFDVMDAMTGNTYGSSYGATDYSAPAASSYGAPSTGYDAHGHSQYKARTFYDGDDDVQLTPEQRALYPELAKLQDDINKLRENEIQLRNQIFYNTGASSDLTGAASGQIGYSY